MYNIYSTERNPGENINVEREHNQEFYMMREQKYQKSYDSNRRLDIVPEIKVTDVLPSKIKVKFQMSVTEEITAPKASSDAEGGEEQTTAQMTVKKSALEPQDLYVFTFTLLY
jgi:hypothetical protein